MDAKRKQRLQPVADTAPVKQDIALPEGVTIWADRVNCSWVLLDAQGELLAERPWKVVHEWSGKAASKGKVMSHVANHALRVRSQRFHA